jgi:hypothetical protein
LLEVGLRSFHGDEGRFQEALDISLDNFKYFEKKQSGKTNFLNVIQGTFTDEYSTWYHKFKDFDFNLAIFITKATY